MEPSLEEEAAQKRVPLAAVAATLESSLPVERNNDLFGSDSEEEARQVGAQGLWWGRSYKETAPIALSRAAPTGTSVGPAPHVGCQVLHACAELPACICGCCASQLTRACTARLACAGAPQLCQPVHR